MTDSTAFYQSEADVRKILNGWGEKISPASWYAVMPNHHLHGDLREACKQFHFPVTEGFNHEMQSPDLTIIVPNAYLLCKTTGTNPDPSFPLGIFTTLQLAKDAANEQFPTSIGVPYLWDYLPLFGLAGCYDTLMRNPNRSVELRIIPMALDHI